MTNIKVKTSFKRLPKGFTVDPTLADKYADQPLFKKKTQKTNEIIRKYGMPKM